MPPAVEAQSPNHWTARDFPRMVSLASDLPGTLASLQISAKGLKKRKMRWQLENEVSPPPSHLLPESGRRLS